MPRDARNRNPYGSAGGYVVDGRNMRDRARGDRARNGRDYRGSDMAGYSKQYDRAGRQSYNQQDYERGGRGMERGRQSAGTSNPFEVRGTWTKGGYMADYGSRDYADYNDYDDYDDYNDYNDYEDDYRQEYRGDYHKKPQMLNDRELMDFSKRLLEEVDEKEKHMFKLESIEKKAKELGIKFEEFTMEEFYTVVLMMFTDYRKTLGTSSMDVYLRLAKDWLCDEDTAVQYGEKLATYYDYVVEGI